jgi:hypothetical protein
MYLPLAVVDKLLLLTDILGRQQYLGGNLRLTRSVR